MRIGIGSPKAAARQALEKVVQSAHGISLIEINSRSTIQPFIGTGSCQDPDRHLERCTVEAREFIAKTVTENSVVLFMKGTAQFPQCGFSGRAVQILKSCGVRNLVTVNVLEDDEVRQAIKDYSNWPTIPQLYIAGEFIGGSDIMQEMFQSGELQKLVPAAAPEA